MQPLEARRSQAGSSMRCPWCNTPQTVPQESRDDREHEQYDLTVGEPGAASGSEAAPAETFFPVVCGLCHTRMYAAPEQVGEKLVCPDCGTPTIVLRPVHKTAAEKPDDAADADIYDVIPGSDQPPPTSKAVYGKYIRVICGVCRTRMLATEDQVGQEMVCPDCGRTTRVPPPAEVGDLDRADVTQAGEYGLGGVDQPAPGSSALRKQFAYRCPVCSTRLLAMSEEAGHETRCPDCLTTFAIPEPPAPHPSPLPAGEGTVDPYRTVGKVVVAPPVQVSGFAPVVGGDEPLRPLTEEEMGGRRVGAPRRSEPPPLPRRMFVQGVFDFPIRSSAWPRWVMLIAFGTVVGLLVGLAVSLVREGGASLILVVFVCGPASFLAGIWLFRMAMVCLTIVVDTAGGIDSIDSWSQENFLDHVFDFLYLFGSFGWGVLPGLLLDSAFRAFGLPQGVGLLPGLFLVPPIALLSMLETGTWINPFSLPLWGSLFWGWRGWAMFYLMAALLDAAVVLLMIGLGFALGLYGLYLVPALLVTWLMIYFRLLGRLGLYCADRIARQRREAR